MDGEANLVQLQKRKFDLEEEDADLDKKKRENALKQDELNSKIKEAFDQGWVEAGPTAVPIRYSSGEPDTLQVSKDMTAHDGNGHIALAAVKQENGKHPAPKFFGLNLCEAPSEGSSISAPSGTTQIEDDEELMQLREHLLKASGSLVTPESKISIVPSLHLSSEVTTQNLPPTVSSARVPMPQRISLGSSSTHCQSARSVLSATNHNSARGISSALNSVSFAIPNIFDVASAGVTADSVEGAQQRLPATSLKQLQQAHPSQPSSIQVGATVGRRSVKDLVGMWESKAAAKSAPELLRPLSMTGLLRQPKSAPVVQRWLPRAPLEALLHTHTALDNSFQLQMQSPRMKRAQPPKTPRTSRLADNSNMSMPEPEQPDYSKMPISAIKLELGKRGLDCLFCFTREDLVRRLRESDRYQSTVHADKERRNLQTQFSASSLHSLAAA